MFFLLVMMIPLTASAAISAGKRIVDEAVDTSDSEVMRLDLKFEMHVNYLWHFPHVRNTQFLIAVQPVNGLARYDLDLREHIRIPKSLSSIISDLYYDGTQGNKQLETEKEEEKNRFDDAQLSNHFIVLETTRKVSINIKQGRDGRSLVIEFKSVAPSPAPDCTGKATNRKE